MSIVASGMLTIVDVNDSKQLQLYVSASQPKTQIYDPNNGSYTPNWTINKPILTPQLFIAGTSEDIIANAKQIKWFIDGVAITASNTDYTLGANGVSLTINTNVLANDDSKVYVCEVVYTDTDTNFDVTAKADIELVKVSAGVNGQDGTGANAVVGVLSNDIQMIPTDSEGNNGNYYGANTTISIYEGSTDVTDSWTISVKTENVTGSMNGTVYTVTDLSADVGKVTFTASKVDYVNIVKIFTLSKNKQGIGGQDGATYYTWIRYADDALGTNITEVADGKPYLGIAYNKSTPTGSNIPNDYAWSKIEGNQGVTGEQGANGETYYTWIRYANDELGNGITDNGTGKAYIGISYNNLNQTESNNPYDYTWTRIKGEDGLQGLQGAKGDQGIKGEDGSSSYTHIAYSDSADGTLNFSVSDSNRTYIGMYVDTIATDSITPSDYKWTLIKGADGSQGIQGTKGADGKTPYLHIAYADSADGTVGFSTTISTNKEYIGQYTDFTALDSSLASAYKWTKVKGEQGIQGERGEQGIQGLQGIQGEKGDQGLQGVSSYTHIAYANNYAGTNGFSLSDPTNKTYIGMYVDSIATDSTDPNKYKWTLIKGADGANGIQGAKGDNGQTPYLHIAYATNATGTSGFSITDPTFRTYIGTYTDYISEDSAVPSRYTWVKIKGADGYTPVKGVDYFDGMDGTSAYVWVKYTEHPYYSYPMYDSYNYLTKYIGIATTPNPSPPYIKSAYKWSLFKGQDGVAGEKGKDGYTSYFHVKYSNDGGATFTANNGEAVGTYIGTYVDFNQADSSNISWYTWNKVRGNDGVDGYTPVKGVDYFDGIDGVSSYLHVRYSANADGSSMTIDPANAKYIGIATIPSSIAPTLNTDYRWSLIKGTDGIKGEDGLDGKTSYLHIKYSNDNGVTFTANSGETVGSYIGTYVDFASTDSANVADYTWNKIKGENGYTPIKGVDYFDGVDGQNGVDGVNGTSSYLWVKYSANSNGNPMTDTPINAKYIGVATTTTASAPTGYASYKWTLIKGTDGIDGEKGLDGKTSYLHVKYSNDNGVTFTANNGEDVGIYIGTYVDFTSADSTNVTSYTWNKVKGEDGYTPVKGVDYFDGVNGQDGIDGSNGTDGTSSYLWVKYSANANGNPMTDIPSKYIGVAVTTTPTEPSTYTSYKWTLIQGTDGVKGEDGANGQTSYLHIKYSDNGTTFTANNGETVGAWIGTYVDFTSADSTTFSKYTWNKVRGNDGLQGLQGEKGDQGIKGTDGQSSYTHIAYANSSDGVTGFSVSDALSKAYVGMYVDNTATDSTDPTKYKWTLVKGSDGSNGIAGKDGLDGKTPYLHIAYATNITGTTGFSVSDPAGKTYIGQYTDFIQADSTDPARYKWTLIKGVDGTNGTNGQSATAYWLISSVSAIQRNISNVYTPASLTFNAKSQTGTSSVINYAGRFIISESTDGSTYTVKYTSSVNESTRTYTPSAGIKTLKIQMYKAGGTTTLLDEEVIPVVEDGQNGANGQDAVRAVVWTPNGNVIRNGEGTLMAQCDFYKGSMILTSGVTYQWYVQDPTQATDIGGGIGWKKLDGTYNLGTTGYATAILTIPASAVPNVESFKCVATYNSKKYHDVCTVSDVSDPISVVLSGVNVFKNGQGTTTLTARLYQAGVEIDSAGNQGFTYTWYLYNENNVKNTTWNGTGNKTGKTIVVYASDIASRGNIVCEAIK